jgi:hypothetical protein
LLMMVICGDRAHGHIAEPMVNIFVPPHPDLPAPRPPANHRQAAQRNNRRGHGDSEDGDGTATGTI